MATVSKALNQKVPRRKMCKPQVRLQSRDLVSLALPVAGNYWLISQFPTVAASTRSHKMWFSDVSGSFAAVSHLWLHHRGKTEKNEFSNIVL